MTVYVVAQLRFVDRSAYDRYQARFMSVFAAFDGRLLAADEHPERLEGGWDRDKVVILSFPDTESARAFVTAPAYREIAKDRRAGAECVVLLVQGLAPPKAGRASIRDPGAPTRRRSP